MWLETDEQGDEGVIAAMIPGLEHMGPHVLQNRKREVAQKMRSIATHHALEHRVAVRFAHLREVPDAP